MRKASLWMGWFLMGFPLMATADLFEYVRRPEPVYAWTETKQEERPLGQVAFLDLTSQTWQNIVWKHRLVVLQPKNLEVRDTAVLLITGGGPGITELGVSLAISSQIGAVMAILYDIPNQPLFGDLKEDDLIAHTFVQYLATRDENWPLLFPMTKAAVKAMDALQEWSEKRLGHRFRDFVVTGGSKRGWTTWLTGVVDPRVRAIAPIVYDNLNLPAQMRHQIETWGRYSEQIEEYTRRGLQQQLETEEGRRLGAMVDPYTYLDRLTMPKLLIMGTNDRYWTLDAVNLYFPDLRGEKYICYVPNAGHSLEPNLLRAVNTLAAFFLHSIGRLQFPTLGWAYRRQGEEVALEIEADREPKEMLLWVARSETRDFREAKWESRPMEKREGKWVGRVPLPEQGYVALFGEFSGAERAYSLCTPVQIFRRERG